MLLMYYPSITGEDLPYYSKKSTWNLFHAYIDAHSQILIGECPGYGLQAISRMQSQCTKTIFSDKNRYDKMFQKVVHKWRESAIIYIKIFQNNKALAVSVVNSYTEDHLMNTFLENI